MLTPRPSYMGHGIAIPFLHFWHLCLKSRGQSFDTDVLLNGAYSSQSNASYAYCSETFFNRLLESAFGPTTAEKEFHEAALQSEAALRKRQEEAAKAPTMVPAIGLPPTLTPVPGTHADKMARLRPAPANGRMMTDNPTTPAAEVKA